MFEKCVQCDRIGKDCIPNLYIMPVEDIREWARMRKDFIGWSNAYLSEKSGVPKGTIDSSFSLRTKKNADVNYSTFAPILCALIGCDEVEPICQKYAAAEVKSKSETVEVLKDETEKLQARIADEETFYRQLVEKTKAEYLSRIEYMKEQLKWRKQVIIIMLVIACVMLTFILAELSVDCVDSNFGMIWR